MPIFGDTDTMKELHFAIKDVDTKYARLKIGKGGITHDMLEKYETITRGALSTIKGLTKQEFEALKDFEEAVAIRKSCLQIMVILMEFLSNSIIKNGQVVVENAMSPKKSLQQVTITKVTAEQHSELSDMIYQKFELLDLVYTQIIMRIVDDGVDTDVIYTPSIEEVKLTARAFASMPFTVLQKKNPAVNPEAKFTDIVFSVSGYFIALKKIVDQAYQPPQDQTMLIMNKSEHTLEQKTQQKQSAYFALFALLEFITNAPLAKDTKEKGKDLKLSSMSYSNLMQCLVNTGLLQKVVQLPMLVDVNNQQEDSTIRLSLKVLISLIFKGQNSQVAFSKQHQVTQGAVPSNFESVFKQQGIRDEAEMRQVMQQMQSMVQKVHNFEIAQINQDSYVMYLHLLSQVCVNCRVEPDATIAAFQTTDQFLSHNINEYLQMCLQEDLRKKLINQSENAQKIMVYQFFFINYLISVCQVDVLQQKQKDNERPIS
jgi:hypothetical protein